MSCLVLPKKDVINSKSVTQNVLEIDESQNSVTLIRLGHFQMPTIQMTAKLKF